MLMVWFNKPHDLTTFTPAWAFLVFPMMLVGVIAFNVLRVIPPEEPRAIGVLLVGYAFQGLGMGSVTLPCDIGLTSRRVLYDTLLHLYLCHSVRPSPLTSSTQYYHSLTSHFLRIMTTGFLEGHQANGAFVAVGPPGTPHPRNHREKFPLTNRV